MSGPSILVVDDERPIIDLVRGYLERDGFTVHVASDGPSGVEAVRRLSPDVVVLDLMLPGYDGLEACRRIRTFSDAYIVMLTARSEEIDRVVGLSVGADDYVTKPFSPRELTARIRAILRRERGPDQSRVLMFQTLRIDPARREVWKHDVHVELTTREFDLLYALASYPGHVLSREQLITRVWGAEYFGDDRVVDAHIKDLRRKLGDAPGHPRLIETVRGIGYKFGDAPA